MRAIIPPLSVEVYLSQAFSIEAQPVALSAIWDNINTRADRSHASSAWQDSTNTKQVRVRASSAWKASIPPPLQRLTTHLASFATRVSIKTSEARLHASNATQDRTKQTLGKTLAFRVKQVGIRMHKGHMNASRAWQEKFQILKEPIRRHSA